METLLLLCCKARRAVSLEYPMDCNILTNFGSTYCLPSAHLPSLRLSLFRIQSSNAFFLLFVRCSRFSFMYSAAASTLPCVARRPKRASATEKPLRKILLYIINVTCSIH